MLDPNFRQKTQGLNSGNCILSLHFSALFSFRLALLVFLDNFQMTKRQCSVIKRERVALSLCLLMKSDPIWSHSSRHCDCWSQKHMEQGATEVQ